MTEIVAYDPSHAQGVTELLNRLTADLPHCYPAEVERVAATLEGREPACELHEGLSEAEAWVATNGGAVVGFAHVAAWQPKEGEEPRGLVRFLAYEPGHREMGQALVQSVEGHFRSAGLRELVAFHQDAMWPFYHFPHCYLSDRLNHIHALLGINGWERCAGEVYYEWRDFEPPPPAPVAVKAAFRTDVREGGMRPHFGVLAHRDDDLVAQCWCDSCGPRAPGSEAEDWCQTTWLHVEEAYRAQRLGAYMLARALGVMRDFGYRHAAISTSWTNWRAQLFYSNLGYRTSDWTYALSKTLE